MKRYILIIIAVIFAYDCKAQNTTFNHDRTFMQQFLFTETGAGVLTPDFYYDLFHRQYRNKFMGQGKLVFRTVMGTNMFAEVPHAEKLDSALQKRAAIEVLNVADREIDLAWLAEGPKIENKLLQLQNSINSITTQGGKEATRILFQEEHDKLSQAVASIKEAYLPNNERKNEYIKIYHDIAKTKELCDNAVLYIKSTKLCSKMKHAQKLRRTQMGNIAIQAHGRWRTNLVRASGGNTGSNGNNGLPTD